MVILQSEGHLGRPGSDDDDILVEWGDDNPLGRLRMPRSDVVESW